MRRAQANWQVITLLISVIFLLIFIGFVVALKGGSMNLVDKISNSIRSLI